MYFVLKKAALEVKVCFPKRLSDSELLYVLQKQLVAQKIHIEENEDRDTGLEQRHYKEDTDCVTAKVPLGDLDLYDGTFVSLESKDIKWVVFACAYYVISLIVIIKYVIMVLFLRFSSPEDYLDQTSPLPPDLEKPDCAKILDLSYSIHAFQHLRVSVLSAFSFTHKCTTDYKFSKKTFMLINVFL